MLIQSVENVSIFFQISMSNFHPLQVVGRGSETQLQVGINLNWIT